MRINRSGNTRIIIELDDVVVKLPNFLKNWETFIRGLLSNMDEHNIWAWNTGKFEKGFSYLLCPILWGSWGGWIIIMKKVDKVLTYDDYWKLDEEALKEHMHFAGDDVGPNYGYLNGKLVKIDYAQIKY